MPRTLKTADWFDPDGLPIKIERREPQEEFGYHAHEFSEIVVITGGRAMHVVGRDSWPLLAGDVFVIGGPQAHNYEQMESLQLVNILFQPARLNLELLDLPTLPGYHALFKLEPAWRKRHRFKSRLHLPPKELGILLGLIDALQAELDTRAPGFHFLGTTLFMQIVGYLSRCYSQTQNPDSRALLRLGEAISHLESHFQEPANLEELAATARMSKRSFLRAFQAATGSSPIAFLIKLRLNRAARLLREGSAEITEIAFDVGFNDSNYFTRQFRTMFGVSPRVYRNVQRAG